MNWLEVKVDTVPERIDGLCIRLEGLGVEGLVIEDEAQFASFLENNRQYWDYIDEDLESSMHGLCRVKFYLEDSDEGQAELSRLRAALPEFALETRCVRDEDWENNWKQYYKPLPVGEKLLIVPEWETAPETGGRQILRLDPGLIFGTGAHPTTQMCLEALEKLPVSGANVLDLGCGSGILAIAALLLQAAQAVGCDIDPKAPNVVMENAAMNGIGGEQLSVYCGDILSDKGMQKKIDACKYDIVLANIVADVIIALAPAARARLAEKGTFVCSGIIEGRQAEVEAALSANGLSILEHKQSGDWHCYVCVGGDE